MVELPGKVQCASVEGIWEGSALNSTPWIALALGIWTFLVLGAKDLWASPVAPW